MAKIIYPRTSPYFSTPQSNSAMGVYRHRSILPHPEDEFVILDAKYHLRPDKMSLDLYGTPALYWVFMVRNLNVIRDATNDFTAGKGIFVPSNNYLSSLGIR